MSSSATEDLADAAGAVEVVAAVAVEADDDALELRATFDLVGVIPESTDFPSMSLVGNDFVLDSFLEVMNHSVAAVAMAARPMTMYVVCWLLLPMFTVFSGYINNNIMHAAFGPDTDSGWWFARL